MGAMHHLVTIMYWGAIASGIPTIRETLKLVPSDRPTGGGEGFGYSSAIRGDVLIIGAPEDDDLAPSGGAAYVFRRNDGGTPSDPSDDAWIEEAKLRAADGGFLDRFGWSVCIDGEYAAVGAPAEEPSGAGPGATYIFHRVAGVWTEQAKLTSPLGNDMDFFGHSVAIDGSTVVVGAIVDGDGSGRSYIYRRNGTAWNLEAPLQPTGAGLEDLFGVSVAVDGGLVIVGAPGDSQTASQAGAAYIYRWDGAAWVPDAKLTLPEARPSLFLGWSVAVERDIALAGSLRASGIDLVTGAVYVFGHATGTWTQSDRFWAGDGANFDDFGMSIALNGSLALVGSPDDDDADPGASCASGSAYMFTRVNGGWFEAAKFVPSDTTCNQRFGSSTALSGTTALIQEYLFDLSRIPPPVPATSTAALAILGASLLAASIVLIRRRPIASRRAKVRNPFRFLRRQNDATKNRSGGCETRFPSPCETVDGVADPQHVGGVRDRAAAQGGAAGTSPGTDTGPF
jgi:hypothetical protein